MEAWTPDPPPLRWPQKKRRFQRGITDMAAGLSLAKTVPRISFSEAGCRFRRSCWRLVFWSRQQSGDEDHADVVCRKPTVNGARLRALLSVNGARPRAVLKKVGEELMPTVRNAMH